MVQAFDKIAAEYDARFTSQRLGRWLREAVWVQLEAVFKPGDHVLELGCGTGTDAIWLAGQGIHVVATDGSPAMLQLAQRKVVAAGAAGRVQLHRLDLATLKAGEGGRVGPPQQVGSSQEADRAWQPEACFDGVLSNFGALNCLPERRALASALAGWMRPGGRAVLVVMGPFCPWEMAWHLLHGQPRTALRRWSAGIEANMGDSASVRVWYPTPRRLRNEFSPWFRHQRTAGIGVLLPPPYLHHLVDRWPHPFQKLAGRERRWGGRFPWTWLNDHYLMVLERTVDGHT